MFNNCARSNWLAVFKVDVRDKSDEKWTVPVSHERLSKHKHTPQ